MMSAVLGRGGGGHLGMSSSLTIEQIGLHSVVCHSKALQYPLTFAYTFNLDSLDIMLYACGVMLHSKLTRYMYKTMD